MLYELRGNKFKKISYEKIKSNHKIVGYINFYDFENNYEKLNINKQIIDLCKNSNDYLNNISKIYDNTYFDIINIKSMEKITNNIGRIGIILRRNTFIIIIIEDNNYYLNSVISSIFYNNKYTFDNIISELIEKTILNKFDLLEYFDKKIMNIEKEIFNKKLIFNLDPLIFSIKKELNLYKIYYEYILDFIESIKIHLNDDKNNLKYIKNIENKLTRLSNNTQYLIDSCVHLREIYQSRIDFYQNRIIKTLTLVTTIFLPLTLVTGWYGMNFEHMPEIHSKYGYPIVFLVCLIFVILLLVIFKRKKVL